MPEILSEAQYAQHLQDGGEALHVYSTTLVNGEERKTLVYFTASLKAHEYVAERAESDNEGWVAQFTAFRGNG